LLKRKATALAYCIRNARENLLTTAALSLTPRTIANYYGCLWLASALMVADPKSEIDLERLEKFTKHVAGRPALCFRLYSANSMNRDEDVEDRKKASSRVMKRTRAYTWLALGSSNVALDEHLREHGPPLEDLEIRDNDGDRSWTGRLPHPVGAPWDRHLPTYRSVMAPTCWIKPVLSRINDPFALQLMLLYELSILGRYRPAVWREVLEGSFDHYRTLILVNNAVVARVIPELVLRQIVGSRQVHVTTPGSVYAPI
jgi:hypothetical protein